MRLEWRLGLVAIAALVVGTAGARYYAQLAVPYYKGAAELIAQLHPWRVVSLELTNVPRSHSTVVLFKGEVFRNQADQNPAALIVSRVQVGEVVETPLIFWTALLLWPAASTRPAASTGPAASTPRLLRLAIGLPVFLGLEALTTVCQLLQPMSEASAMLAGDNDPLTLLDRWSRFLESGGRFVVEIVAALLTCAAAYTFRPSSSAHRTVTISP